jgi:transcriptional regulator with XRE-family HTH domain
MTAAPQPPRLEASTILAELKRRGITQSQIARACQCTDALVWQVIHGRRPTARIQDEIATQLGVPVASLFPARALAPVPSVGAEAASAA